MILRPVSLAAAVVTLLFLGACAADTHKHDMMGGKMMGNGMMEGGTQAAATSRNCAMMQDGKPPTGDGGKPKPKDMAGMSGCPMMGQAAKGATATPDAKPSEDEDHAKHHPGS